MIESASTFFFGGSLSEISAMRCGGARDLLNVKCVELHADVPASGCFHGLCLKFPLGKSDLYTTLLRFSDTSFVSSYRA